MTAPRPLSLLCELTYRCNLQCPYCYNPLNLSAYRDELDVASWQRVVGEAADLGVLQIHVSGGEPTLVPESALGVVEAAAARGLYTNLITQGTFLDDALLERFVSAGLDHVQISIQAPEAELADRIAGTRVHEQKLEAIERVMRRNVAFTLNCVLHRANHDRLEATIALAERLGVRRLELANTQFYGWAYKNRAWLMPTREQVRHGEDVVAQARERLRGKMEIVYVLPDYFEELPKPCMHGWGNAFVTVTPNGTVLPCPAAAAITTLRFENVRDRTLRFIWESSESFGAYRGTAWMPEPCRSCDRREIDFGGCRCQAFAVLGDAGLTDPACAKSPNHGAMLEAIGETPPSEFFAAPYVRNAMNVRILGSAAGGGVPQWNCGCPNCKRARRGELPQRTQSSIAVGEGNDWMLVNASVDLPRQLAAMPELWPAAVRATPFRAILLTDANVDHTAGLGELRQGPDAFAVVSSPVTKALLAAERAYERFDRDPHRWIAAEPDGTDVAAQIHPSIAQRFEVAAYDVPGLLPGYAGRTTWRGAVVAYRIRDRASGANVVIAPVYSAIDETLMGLIENADLALLDGTFFSEDELQSLGLPAKPASAMGHVAIGGPGGTLERVAAVGSKCVLVHINNTNPILDPASEAFTAVTRAGVRVAMDGEAFTL